jgi:hypothetical protein
MLQRPAASAARLSAIGTGSPAALHLRDNFDTFFRPDASTPYLQVSLAWNIVLFSAQCPIQRGVKVFT